MERFNRIARPRLADARRQRLQGYVGMTILASWPEFAPPSLEFSAS